MRIAINLLSAKARTSMLTYAYNLTEQLQKIDNDNDYFLILSPANQGLFSPKNTKWNKYIAGKVTNKASSRLLWEHLVLPRILKKQKIDILLAPGNIIPFFSYCSIVVVIHFMINFSSPKAFARYNYLKKKYFNFFIRRSIIKADRVIAVSESIRHEIKKYINVPDNKIMTVHHGVNECFKPALPGTDTISEARGKYGLAEKYILSVGSDAPNKNFDGLARAFALLKTRYNIHHKLVLAGIDNMDFPVRDDIKNDIICLGHLPPAELADLYRSADVFTLVSHCESFGLPVIEAMSCGTAIVVSDIPALSEIAGQAGIRVDPSEPENIAEGIYTLIANQSLKGKMVKKGLDRVKHFTWEQTARETLAVMESLNDNR